jgi:hypothetical protein
MKHVVERCPSCGVEHEAPGDGRCEACGEALRPWCRRHGRDIGWLREPACPRCAAEAAHPAPAPRPPVRPAPVRAPVPPRPEAPVRPPPPPPTAWPGGRSPREILRGPAPSPALREKAEADAAARQGRSVSAFFTTAIGAVMGGWVLGWMLGLVMGGDPRDMAFFCAFVLGGGGIVVGMVRSAAAMMDDPPE